MIRSITLTDPSARAVVLQLEARIAFVPTYPATVEGSADGSSYLRYRGPYAGSQRLNLTALARWVDIHLLTEWALLAVILSLVDGIDGTTGVVQIYPDIKLGRVLFVGDNKEAHQSIALPLIPRDLDQFRRQSHPFLSSAPTITPPPAYQLLRDSGANTLSAVTGGSGTQRDEIPSHANAGSLAAVSGTSGEQASLQYLYAISTTSEEQSTLD